MRIFITGATGYIGNAIAMKAAIDGWTVHALARNLQSPHLPVHPNIHCFNGDINSPETLTQAIEGCDAVIHTAGLTRLHSKDVDAFYKINVEGTRNVLEAALAAGVKRFVFTSSCAVLGPSDKHPVAEDDPRITAFENDYEITKHAAELLVAEYVKKGLQAVIVAPSRVYGPGINTNGNPISQFIRNILRRRFAFIPAAESVIGNYVYLDDVVNGHFLALEKGKAGEKYNTGGENCTYHTFFNTIQKYAPARIYYLRLPKWSLQLISISEMIFSSVTGRHTHLNPKVISRLFQNRAVSTEKAVRELGYKITGIDEGISKTIQDITNHNADHEEHRTDNRRGSRTGKIAVH